MIKIKYDGYYPNLCRGHLEVWVDEKYYDFGEYCLISGGAVSFDENWEEHITKGDWSIDEENIPKDFPKELLPELLEEINIQIPHGCCGGCV